MKIPIQTLPLLFVLSTFLSASSANEAKTVLAPKDDENSGLSFSAEFGSSGATRWRPSNQEQAKVGTLEKTYGVSQALIKKPEETLTTSVEYHQTTFEFDGAGVRPPLPERLVGAKLNALYTRQLNPMWSYGALAEIGSFTAGRKNRWSGGGGSISLGLVAQYRVNPAVALKLGAIYQTLAEGNERLVPTIGFAWQINQVCRFSVGFPKTALTYQLTDRLRLGLVGKGNFETYRMKSEPIVLPSPGITLQGQKLSYTEIAACLEIEYVCTRRMTLRASVGQVLQRTAEYRSRGLKLESQHNPPVGSFGLEFEL